MKDNIFLENINGATVIMYPMESVQAIHMDIRFYSGSFYEKTKQWGAMHLLEHMTFKTTSKFKSKLDMEYFKETWGISSNASTSQEFIEFWYAFPNYSINKAMELMKEQIFNPKFKEDELEKEKQIISQEYTDKWSNPFTRFSKDIVSNEYGKNHLFVRDGMGQPEYVNSITVSKLKNIHKEFFYPENMIVSIAGKFEPEKITKLLKKYLPPKTQKKEKTIDFEKTKISRDMVWTFDDEDKMNIELAWKRPGYKQVSDKELEIYALIRYILGGSARSMLFLKLREDKGIVYRTGASANVRPTTGSIIAWASISPKNFEIARKEITNTVHDFHKNLDKETFKRAKNYIKTREYLSYDSVESISSSFASNMFFYKKPFSLEEVIKTIDSITYEDVIDFSQNIFNKKNFLYCGVLSRDNPF